MTSFKIPHVMAVVALAGASLLLPGAPAGAADCPRGTLDARYFNPCLQARGGGITLADMQQRFEFPVYLQNDATAACGAELVFGEYTEARDFVYFYFGYFIGGGVVLNGRLYSGRSGNAGALGPMRVPDRQGEVRQLIDLASISVLERKLREAGADEDADRLWESPDAWNVDQAVLDDWIDLSAQAIAQATITSESIIDFEAIVVDGWLPQAVRVSLVKAIRAYLEPMDFTGL